MADHSAEVTWTIRGRDNHNVVPSAAAVSLLMGLVRQQALLIHISILHDRSIKFGTNVTLKTYASQSIDWQGAPPRQARGVGALPPLHVGRSRHLKK